MNAVGVCEATNATNGGKLSMGLDKENANHGIHNRLFRPDKFATSFIYLRGAAKL